jgi:heat shock protein HslJ
MRHQGFFIVTIALLVVTVSCDTAESTDDNPLIGKWVIVSISVEESDSETTINPTYTLEFAKDSSCGILFDINACGGNYTISSGEKINLAPMFCQKVCCDSDNALKIMGLINSTKSFVLNGDTLFLNGSGTILLIRA